MTRIALTLLLIFVAPFVAAEEMPPAIEMSDEELENFEFERQQEEDPPVIEELSVGQRYILSTQRREIRDLIARDLGVMTLKEDASDLRVIQSLYDRRILKENQVREWQAVGVLFGDILVNEYDFEWVSYEDDLGVSKALRWRDSDNFVFPITVFSKRLQFGEDIDARAVYDKITADIERFIAFEQRKRELDPGSR